MKVHFWRMNDLFLRGDPGDSRAEPDLNLKTSHLVDRRLSTPGVSANGRPASGRFEIDVEINGALH